MFSGIQTISGIQMRALGFVEGPDGKGMGGRRRG